jgi:hypothetical protein
MKMRRTLTLLIALLAVQAPAGAKTRPALISAQGWHAAATGVDRLRIRDWRKTFVKAIAEARRRGHGSAIDAEGALLEPDLALAEAAPPAGDYRCRTIKIGVKGAAVGDYVVYPGESCRIGPRPGGGSFARLTGPQRILGRLYPDAARRTIFLGTVQFGDEKAPIPYGADEMRNAAGLLQRIGERRWRLVLPAPHFESSLDVIELLPR